MAFRCICSKLHQCNLFQSFTKVRLSHKKSGSVRHISGSSAAEPPVPWLDKPSVVFSVDALNHHWGAWPVVIISTIGLALEILAIMRLAVKRDDVWYTKSPAACEVLETRKGYPAPVRKLVVYNQKYETPKELIEALRSDVDGPPCDTCKDNKDDKSNVVLSKKKVAAHAIASLGVIYLAFFM